MISIHLLEAMKAITDEEDAKFLKMVENGNPLNKNPDFPHNCPYCKSPAYIGFAKIECSVKCLKSS